MRAAESNHWYHRDGRPCYEVPARDGTVRPTTLRDARKLDLIPSVTSIIRLAAAPGLEVWKQQQVLLAAFTLAREPGEAEDAYLNRVILDSREQARKAAEKGSAIHAAIQGHFEGRAPEPELWPYVKGAVEALQDRFQIRKWIAEKSFACEDGYGGKVDLHCSEDCFAVGDIKTKEFVLGDKKKLAWDEHAMQVAAYGWGLGFGTKLCDYFNLFVSTTTPGLAIVHVWKPEEVARGKRMFDALLQFWKARTQLEMASPATRLAWNATFV